VSPDAEFLVMFNFFFLASNLMNTGVPSPGGKAAGVYGYHSSPSGEAKNDWRDKYILFV
jgi:hypothetical protein